MPNYLLAPHAESIMLHLNIHTFIHSTNILWGSSLNASPCARCCEDWRRLKAWGAGIQRGKRQNPAFKTAMFQRHVNSCMQWEKLWIRSNKSSPWSSVWPYVRHLTFNLSKAHYTHLYNGDDDNIYFIDLGRLWESMHMKMICKLHVSDCSKTQNNLCSSVPLQDKPG